MSKRFGRQQKRRARQRIEMLEKELHTCRALGARNRDIVERTARVLGTDLIVFDPAEINQAGGGNERIVKRIRGLKKQLLDAGDWWNIEDVQCAVEESVFWYDVLQSNGVHVDTSRAVHFRVSYGDRRYGYAVSHRALAETNLPFVAEYAARALIRSIVEECRKEGIT